MKKLFNRISNGIIVELIFLALLISPILAFVYYQKSNDYEEKLSDVCGSYQILIETLRNETMRESIERLKSPYTIPDSKTIKGSYNLKLMAIDNEINKGCNDVYGLTATFPTYDEIVKGYNKN